MWRETRGGELFAGKDVDQGGEKRGSS